MCGQRFCKGHICTLLMIFDAHQRSSFNAPLPPRSKAAKAAFTHLRTPVKGLSKGHLWYAFACCQKPVKSVTNLSAIRVKGLLNTWSKIPVTQAKGLSKVPCVFRSRTSRLNFSLALLVRASRPFIAFRAIRIFYAFPACYTGFVALYTKDAFIFVLLFYAWQVWKEFISFNKVFSPNYLQMLTENRPGEILADFKKILILNFTSVLIFPPFYRK